MPIECLNLEKQTFDPQPNYLAQKIDEINMKVVNLNLN